MRAYLAGPMSGIDQANFPAFDAAATVLRAAGWDIVSPAELDDPADRARALANEPIQKTWGEFLSRDMLLIADGGIEAIIFLPGWKKSRGARLEATVGLLQKDFRFFLYAPPGSVIPVPRACIASNLYEAALRDSKASFTI